MKKKSLMTIASLFLVSGLIACGNTETPTSSDAPASEPTSSVEAESSKNDTPVSSESSAGVAHNYDSNWSNDKGNHWHACGDAGCDEKSDFGAHTMVKDAAASVEATCQQKGKLVEKCSVCGYTSETVTPLAAHNYVKDTEKSVDDTCETNGKIVEKCSVCGDEKTTNITAAGHRWNVDPSDPRNCESTHTKNGVTVEVCSTCKEDREVKMPMEAHTWTKAEGETLTTVSGKTVQKWTCECGTASYTMDVYDWDFLSPGSNAAGVDGFNPGTDAGHANGMRIAGNGSVYWNFPVVAAGKMQIAVGANPAPTSISGTKIEDKNTIKVNDEVQTLIPRGAYNTLPITIGQFDELLLAEYEATEDMVGTEAKIEITQKASSRMYWGGVVRVTFLPAEPHVHEWAADACACGAHIYKSTEAVLAEGSSNKSGTPAGYMKLSSNGQSMTYTVNSPKAGKAILAVDGKMDSWPSNGAQGFYNASGHTATPNFKFTVNGTDLADLELVKGKSFNDLGCVAGEGGYSADKMIELASIDVNEGANTIQLTRLASYNYLVSAVCLIVK